MMVREGILDTFGEEAVTKPQSVNLMTSARHELGKCVSNKVGKKDWKLRYNGVGWDINIDFGINQFRKARI